MNSKTATIGSVEMDVTFLDHKREMIDAFLDSELPPIAEHPQGLHEAIRYSALAPAKRIRPILALTTYDALCDPEAPQAPAPLGPACALELVHTYSLIHDDLPCMDNDDLRRGRPTLHRKFNEGVAVLAGDALHDLAFKWVASAGNTQLVTELADAIGSYGMIGGQVADMEAEGREITEADIAFIHLRKTAALMRCSSRFGAILADASADDLAALTAYGEKLGLAFQIVDDILDIEGDQTKLGKNVGSDQKNHKATYPAVVGIERSRAKADELIGEAIGALSGSKFPTERLTALARYIGRRES